MKKNTVPYFGIFALGMAIVGSTHQTEKTDALHPETTQITVVAPEKYTADISASTIQWTGYKPTGSHTGTISLEQGELVIDQGAIDSGNFTIDMTTIEDEGDNERLENHLKSADFFDAGQFPKSKFVITGVKKADGKTMLMGDLTIKNITNAIMFPVIISHTDDTVTLSSDIFTIDRAKWDIKTRSKSFFTNLGDKLINDEIELKIAVKATKLNN